MLVGRRFKSCPADHLKSQVTRLNAVAFFVPCAKRVQSLSRENKKAPPAEAESALRLDCRREVIEHRLGERAVAVRAIENVVELRFDFPAVDR